MRWLCAVLWALLSGGTAAQAVEAPQRADPTALKLAFLVNFPQFVEWPADAFGEPGAPFQLCIVGAHPFGLATVALQERRLRDRPLLLQYPRTPAEARGCHMAFADDPAAADSRVVWRALLERPVLTVASAPGDASAPAVLTFQQRGDRLRWAADLEAARKSRLRLSSKLVELAVSVSGPAPERAP